MFSRLKYSHRFRCTVDPTDLTVWNQDGKKLTFYMTRDYMQTGSRLRQVRLYLHRIIADACVPNPRPDLFHVVDHINGCTTDNRPCNLRWVNPHLNTLNLWPSKGYSNICESTRKWGGKWLFYKCGKYLANFMNKDLAIQFAKDFNKKHFFRLTFSLRIIAEAHNYFSMLFPSPIVNDSQFRVLYAAFHGTRPVFFNFFFTNLFHVIEKLNQLKRRFLALMRVSASDNRYTALSIK